jgi:hypothetical protein
LSLSLWILSLSLQSWLFLLPHRLRIRPLRLCVPWRLHASRVDYCSWTVCHHRAVEESRNATVPTTLLTTTGAQRHRRVFQLGDSRYTTMQATRIPRTRHVRWHGTSLVCCWQSWHTHCKSHKVLGGVFVREHCRCILI